MCAWHGMCQACVCVHGMYRACACVCVTCVEHMYVFMACAEHVYVYMACAEHVFVCVARTEHVYMCMLTYVDGNCERAKSRTLIHSSHAGFHSCFSPLFSLKTLKKIVVFKLSSDIFLIKN